jgi:hypothetical protein
MSAEQLLPAHEALAIEEADAWFEYLEVTRAELGSGRYHEIEPCGPSTENKPSFVPPPRSGAGEGACYP